MREAFSSNIRSSAYGGMTLTLDYSLTLEQLRRYGGSVYFHELDCVLSLNSLEEAPPHPFSAEGSSMRLIETSPASSGCSFGYSVDVVDNMGRYGDRYINIGGKIYRIDAVKDPVRRDGIYVVSNAPVEGELGGIGPVVKHYPFEGADTQLGLFRTAEEATHLGDASQARKRELAELEHELSIGRKQLQAAKEAHELDMLGMTREMEQLKRKGERDAADLERLRALEELEQKRIKDYYDGKSYERKDNHEALKMIPAIIVGIGAILLALKGLMAPKK